MYNSYKILIALCFVLNVLYEISCNVQPPVVDPGILTQSKSLGDCQACRIFIESFKKGLERTRRGKYEGGDTAWEEEKLKKSYRRSEMRLIDIHDRICRDESKYSVQCHHMAEKAEEFIEQWWSQDADETDDLFTFICIDNLKVCCPKLHFGKDCSPCIGDHNKICSGNGKCRGDGTRKGNGTCLCDAGYMGDNCDNCALDYYLAYKDDNKMLCSKCHPSCLGGCRQASPKDCVACKPGFILDPDDGCQDINECEDLNKCTENQFCLNSLGSFACKACDKSCNRCHGDGPDMCRKCAEGYSYKGEFCVRDRLDEDNLDQFTRGKEDL